MDESELTNRIERLERHVDELRATQEIIRVQYEYGYYLDTRMWREATDLFSDVEASIELGARGVYAGKDKIYEFLLNVLGAGKQGPLPGEVNNHLQLQPVVTVSADRRRAHVRSRTEIVAGSPGDEEVLWAEGVYESTFRRDAQQWRIEHMYWAPSYFLRLPGFSTAGFENAPPSESFPPNGASGHASHPVVGRHVAAFHYGRPALPADRTD